MQRSGLRKPSKRPRPGPIACSPSSSGDDVVEFEDCDEGRSAPQSFRSCDSCSDSDFEKKYRPRGNTPLKDRCAHGFDVQTGCAVGADFVLPWPERFAPRSTEELVTGKSTANKIRKWVSDSLSSRSANKYSARMLVLTGPTGVGKSTAVHLIAKELGCRVDEWKAPSLCTGNQSTAQLLTESVRSFLVGTQYPSLIHTPSERRLLLLDDFPRALSEIRQHGMSEISDVLRAGAVSSLVPIVLIISDTGKQRARALRALGAELLDSPHVNFINVPAATDIAMARAIRMLLLRANASIDDASVEAIVHSSHGDLRSAVNSLHLHSMNLSSNPNTRSFGRSSLKRSRNQRSAARAGVSRLLELAPGVGMDSSLDTFHAVSKILNNKRRADGLSKYNPEQVLEHSRAETVPFLSFLHQNYPLFFKSSDDAANALEFLSDASSMITWRDDAVARSIISDCAAAVATRGFLECNHSPIRSGWRPIHGSEDPVVRAEARELLENARRLFANQELPVWFSARPLAIDLVPYMDVIGWPYATSQPPPGRIRSKFKYVLPVRPSGGNPGGREGAVEVAMIEEEESAPHIEFSNATQHSFDLTHVSGGIEYNLQEFQNVELVDDVIEEFGEF